MTKGCPVCRGTYPLTAFGNDAGRPDGRSVYCLACRRDQARAFRKANADAVRADNARRYRENPDKHRAKVAVARAINRGLITKSPCPCGATITEAHHHRGYNKAHWLDVVFLCRSCHTLLHTRGIVGAIASR